MRRIVLALLFLSLVCGWSADAAARTRGSSLRIVNRPNRPGHIVGNTIRTTRAIVAIPASVVVNGR